jgi:hypothetical protein
MFTGGKKIEKTQKTKFRKNQEREGQGSKKQKHHDKSFYRLMREEKENVV